MAKHTRKSSRKSTKKTKRVTRKHRGGGKCPENCWTNKKGKTVCGDHDFSDSCNGYRGMQRCSACSYCGEWKISA